MPHTPVYGVKEFNKDRQYTNEEQFKGYHEYRIGRIHTKRIYQIAT